MKWAGADVLAGGRVGSEPYKGFCKCSSAAAVSVYVTAAQEERASKEQSSHFFDTEDGGAGWFEETSRRTGSIYISACVYVWGGVSFLTENAAEWRQGARSDAAEAS